MTSPHTPKPTAVLVGVQYPHLSHDAHLASLAELRRLVETLGFEVLATIDQKRKKMQAATVVGQGKLREIAAWTGGPGYIPSMAPNSKDTSQDDDLTPSPDAFSISDDSTADNAHLSQDEEPASAHLEAQDTIATTRPKTRPHQELSDVGVAVTTDADEALEVEQSYAAMAQTDVLTDAMYVYEYPEGQADVVIFNQELTPTQLRNLELATDAEVLDRSGVIIEIFHRHAKTREAKLQIEIAQLKYLAPRLRMSRRGGGDRQAGGIGGKGAGETRHELDRRRIRDRIAELKRQLDSIASEDRQRREKRSQAHTVALVGYTNAGKSSLMRRLTSDKSYVADKLFATLGTTVRVMQPETKPRILISDTVGFIKDLPHELVASFRSTLDEARFASLLLHVVDGSDPEFHEQLEVTRDVLADLKSHDLPYRLVLNKADMIDERTQLQLRREFPDAILMAAHRPQDVEMLKALLLGFFEQDMIEEQLHIPYHQGKLIGEIHNRMRVLHTEHDDTGTLLTVRGSAQDIDAIRQSLALPHSP